MATSMMREPSRGPTKPEGFVDKIRDVTSHFEELISDHLKLARVELITEAKSSVAKLAGAAIAGVFAFVGYLLFMIGVAYLAALKLGAVGGFMLVGGLHLVGAGIGAYLLYRSAKKMKAPMPETRDAVERTVEVTKAALTDEDGGNQSGHH